MGGAVLWTACDRTMNNPKVLPLLTFKETTNYAYSNKAMSGHLIASTCKRVKICIGLKKTCLSVLE